MGEGIQKLPWWSRSERVEASVLCYGHENRFDPTCNGCPTPNQRLYPLLLTSTPLVDYGQHSTLQKFYFIFIYLNLKLDMYIYI